VVGSSRGRQSADRGAARTRIPLARESVDHEDPLSRTERFYQKVSVSPIWVGLGIVAGLLALFLAIAWAFGGLTIVRSGDLGLWEYREVRFGILVAVLAGYLPTARRYVVLEAKKNLEDLFPLLEFPFRGSDAAQRRFGHLDARAARRAGLLGILILPITALLAAGWSTSVRRHGEVPIDSFPPRAT
jgi:hypothetical protein